MERTYITRQLNDDGTIYASAWQDDDGKWFSCTVNDNGYESEDTGPFPSAEAALDEQVSYYNDDDDGM